MYKKMQSSRGYLAILVASFLFGCNEIMLIGAYNENVDQSIQSITKDVSKLFVKLEKDMEDSTDWSYPVFRDSYITIESEIASCKIIANGIPKYKIINEQIDLLLGSVKALENDHKSGFVNNTKEINKLKRAVDVDREGISNALTSILKLQEGLKRVKSDKISK